MTNNLKIISVFSLYSSLLITSACVNTYEMTGKLETGGAVSAAVVADGSGTNKLSIDLKGGNSCTGEYGATGKAVDTSISCGDGVTGTARIIPRKDRLGGEVKFALTDGTKGTVSTELKSTEDVESATNVRGKTSAPPQPFLIRRIERSINSVGGASFAPWAVNGSTKTIKYINYRVTPYNAVGDVQSDSISGMSTKPLKDTGPYSFNQLILGSWTAWYNNTISCFVIQSIKIEYMDGSILTYGNPAEVQKIMAPDLRNSCTV